MVDFDNESTITTAPKEIIKILLLERRKYLIDAMEFTWKKKTAKIKPDLSLLSSRLVAVFYELYNTLSSFYDTATFTALKADVFSGDLVRMEDAFVKIDKWYYDKQLTKIDNIKKYDTTNVEEENGAKGI